jgi:ubiquinone/menaquinone biosynthesis C-methylase UbiE
VKREQARQWLNGNCHRFLRRAGIAEGQRVLDFGCGRGNYTIPAARIVGKRGVVYALDKDPEALDRLMATAESEHLSNVRRVDVADNGHIPLRSQSVDGILLYDVLHGGYFPDERDRRSTLRELRRILRGGGWVSFYPTHLKQYGLTFERLRNELGDAGFAVADNGHTRTLIHDDNLVRGRVFDVRKTPHGALGPRRKSRRRDR